MKTLMSFLVISCMLLACSDETLQQQTIEQDIVADSTKKELPPGYKIICNPDQTQYLPVKPSGFRLYKDMQTNLGYESYEQAFERAWQHYEFAGYPLPDLPPDTVAWQECFNPLATAFPMFVDSTRSSAAQRLTATISGENVSAEKWETMRKYDELTRRINRDGSHSNDTSTITSTGSHYYSDEAGIDSLEILAQSILLSNIYKKTVFKNDTVFISDFVIPSDSNSAEILFDYASNFRYGMIPKVRVISPKRFEIYYDYPDTNERKLHIISKNVIAVDSTDGVYILDSLKSSSTSQRQQIKP